MIKLDSGGIIKLMTNLFLVFILLCSIAILACLIGLLVAIKSLSTFIDSIYSQFVGFINSPGDDKPSEFARLTNTIAHTAGQAIAQEVKTTIMGKMSGDARKLKAIEGDIAMDGLAESAPQLAGLLDASPNLRKRVAKNPGLIGWAAQYLPGLMGGLAGGSGGQTVNQGGTSTPPRFKL